MSTTDTETIEQLTAELAEAEEIYYGLLESTLGRNGWVDEDSADEMEFLDDEIDSLKYSINYLKGDIVHH